MSAAVARSTDFSSHFDSSSETAAAQYAKIMHEHTKAQLGMASESSRRRSQPSIIPFLQTDTSNTSSHNSVSSTAS